jgi:hypothetical protein
MKAAGTPDANRLSTWGPQESRAVAAVQRLGLADERISDTLNG